MPPKFFVVSPAASPRGAIDADAAAGTEVEAMYEDRSSWTDPLTPWQHGWGWKDAGSGGGAPLQEAAWWEQPDGSGGGAPLQKSAWWDHPAGSGGGAPLQEEASGSGGGAPVRSDGNSGGFAPLQRTESGTGSSAALRNAGNSSDGCAPLQGKASNAGVSASLRNDGGGDSATFSLQWSAAGSTPLQRASGSGSSSSQMPPTPPSLVCGWHTTARAYENPQGDLGYLCVTPDTRVWIRHEEPGFVYGEVYGLDGRKLAKGWLPRDCF
jgi:hypothetical protein